MGSGWGFCGDNGEDKGGRSRFRLSHLVQLPGCFTGFGPAAVTTGAGPIQQEGHESEDMEILQAMDKHLGRFF